MTPYKYTYELIVTGGAPPASLPVLARHQVLGSSADCELRLEHPSIHPRHASVEVTDDGLLLQDLTGEGLSRTEPAAERRCHVGQTIRLGEVTLELMDTAPTLPGASDPSKAPAREFGVGTVIAGRYELTAHIASGGMGQVFRARHRELEKDFALKLMHQRFSSDPTLAQRFRREALATSRIGHPNIVDVNDFGSTDDGQFYFTMELLEGKTIGQTIRSDGPLSLERVVAIGRQLATALVAAHAAGVVHRDLKPENVMLVQRPGLGETVKVLDFGIARFQEPGDGDHRLTTGNVVMGTPQYMSPEQAAGLPADARADVYALGLILYEMLSGESTFTAATSALVMVMQINADAPDLGRHVPPGLRRLVARMLRKRPEDRPQTMAEVLAALEAPLGTPGPRSSGLALAAGLAAATALAVAGWGWTQQRPEPVASRPQALAPVVVPPLPATPPLSFDAGATTPVRAPVSISVASVPPGALVKVNGVERGTTPLAVEGQPDEVASVTLTSAGYRPQTFELHFDAGAVPPLKLVALPKAASPASAPIKTWNDSE